MGADGKTYSASCSGLPGTDPEFRLWTQKGGSKNLVVYFEGGGACWDSATCSFPIGGGLPAPAPRFCVSQICPGTNPEGYSGLFDQPNPANPVKDWSFVHVPCCTGDIHTGSATKQYLNAGNPLPGATGAPCTIQHRGFENFMVVLGWLRENFDAPKSILVPGSSAGGYGASADFPHVADSYPNAHTYVLADASQGVTTPAFDTGSAGRNSWNPQFTTTLEDVQVALHGVMRQSYGPGGSCPNPVVDWNQRMIDALDSYGREVKNFRCYLASANYHTIVRSPLFHAESSAGIACRNWLASMLSNRGGTGGAGGGDRRNVACPDCTAALICP